jgi:hypothetical protein
MEDNGGHGQRFAPWSATSSCQAEDRIPGCEMKVLPGAGHARRIEQPWLSNRLMIEFLTGHGLFPSPH